MLVLYSRHTKKSNILSLFNEFPLFDNLPFYKKKIKSTIFLLIFRNLIHSNQIKSEVHIIIPAVLKIGRMNFKNFRIISFTLMYTCIFSLFVSMLLLPIANKLINTVWNSNFHIFWSVILVSQFHLHLNLIFSLLFVIWFT